MALDLSGVSRQENDRAVRAAYVNGLGLGYVAAVDEAVQVLERGGPEALAEWAREELAKIREGRE